MINVQIEIPYGSNVKYEIEDGKLCVDRILSTSMNYPGNYGYIPKTLADDGDPIDVLVINQQPLFPTCYVECKVLGMLVTEDEKGFDQKVIAIPKDSIDNAQSHINDIKDLNETILDMIRNFFSNYKANEADKWVKVYEYEDSKTTLEFIESKRV